MDFYKIVASFPYWKQNLKQSPPQLLVHKA